MEQYDNRVDLYIAKSADFAKPILEYIREVVHEASPLITETIKWGMPFFDCKGPVCQMAAFKQHCAFGFWRWSLMSGDANHTGDAAAGSFGRVTTIEDLPSKEILVSYVLQGIELNEKGIKKANPKKSPAEKAELVIPDYFMEFLAAYPKAVQVFHDFSYSNKKEYVEWITEAKTEATRQKRMETAAEWMSEGKSRNWKYK
ncbi:YdeI/OmpD-associated family protein [Mucilaginibacter sp. 22184]|uniref:YdeI/OmpD-associated family protein n=1 Tax=Mucilaginibacter sp. 22184 TaxID=3453887 RepID=UPI003F83D1FA